jgi:hypothetical protein
LKSKDLKKEKYKKSTTSQDAQSRGTSKNKTSVSAPFVRKSPDIKENGNENGNEELVPFLVDPVSSRHILFWVC